MPTPQRSATTIVVDDRPFIVHLYTTSQALDLLLSLGEVLSEPLSKLLDRQVSSDLEDVAAAVDELRDRDLSAGALLSLFSALRKGGGSSLVVQVLQSTYHADRPIDSRKRLDEVFSGPAGVIGTARLTWGVLVFQLGPLWDALRPLLSERGGALTGALTRLRSAPTSTGASGAP